MSQKTNTQHPLKIGLEIHAYLDTSEKLFCKCSTNTEDKQNKIVSENMNEEESTPNIKSLILLNGKKPKAKAKYRDEEGL